MPIEYNDRPRHPFLSLTRYQYRVWLKFRVLGTQAGLGFSLFHKPSSGALPASTPQQGPGRQDRLSGNSLQARWGNRAAYGNVRLQGPQVGRKIFVGLALGSRKDTEDQLFLFCGFASDWPWLPLLPCLAAPKEQGGDSTVAVMGFFLSPSSLALVCAASPASQGTRSPAVQ